MNNHSLDLQLISRHPIGQYQNMCKIPYYEIILYSADYGYYYYYYYYSILTFFKGGTSNFSSSVFVFSVLVHVMIACSLEMVYT